MPRERKLTDEERRLRKNEYNRKLYRLKKLKEETEKKQTAVERMTEEINLITSVEQFKPKVTVNNTPIISFKKSAIQRPEPTINNTVSITNKEEDIKNKEDKNKEADITNKEDKNKEDKNKEDKNKEDNKKDNTEECNITKNTIQDIPDNDLEEVAIKYINLTEKEIIHTDDILEEKTRERLQKKLRDKKRIEEKNQQYAEYLEKLNGYKFIPYKEAVKFLKLVQSQKNPITNQQKIIMSKIQESSNAGLYK